MGFMSVLSFAHKLVAERLGQGERAIDATVGTGADTLYLARTVGRRGDVYGFDIQAAALELAEARFKAAVEEKAEALPPITLLLENHAEMARVVPPSWVGTVGAVMFNLGYLPAGNADKSIITETASSIVAIEAALSLLRPGGIVTAVLYPGHQGGDTEAAAVEAWASAIPTHLAQSIVYRQLQRQESPYVIALEKKGAARA
ncbi:class I SAM-dependent methyltransferase [Paenibacillus sp. sgz500958]|uniref:tRNA (mnm(5)s(2)U34)-methyltransferase n=1 Tax=Paenibacillus sp. sgz500958 TaxID=3242475 RepID=UPI0036D27975